MPKRYFITTVIASLLCTAVGASRVLADARVKENVWSLALAIERMRYQAQNEEFFGDRGVLSIGYGKFQRQLYYGFSADILMGPYSAILDEKIKTDFYGTGLNVKTSYAFIGEGFRNPAGSWSLDFGLSYSDSVGRSVAKSQEQSDKRVISDLSMRMSQFNGLFSISYNKMEPARHYGNTPELLMTRIEGFSTALGISYPIKATYSMSYQEENGSTTITEGSKRKKNERGSLTGYSLFINFSVFLGV